MLSNVFHYNMLTECERFEERMAEMQRQQQGEEANTKTFYKGMWIASIIAAIALLALIIVTSLYLKRTTTYKAIISGGKKSEFSFDNKAFNGVGVISLIFENNTIVNQNNINSR